MEIQKIVTGMLDENCYVLKKGDTCLVVDPGDDYPKIKELVGDSKVLGVLLTHSHFDHIGALRNFLTKRNVKIYKKSSVEEKEYQVGDFTFQVLYTPGHSSDSISFYFPEDNVMFVGDFIFRESIGRCDLPTGSEDDMKNSLLKLKKFDKDISLYPGHGENTTLNYEKSHNTWLS